MDAKPSLPEVREIRRLLEGLAATDVREFTLDTGDYKISVKRGPEAATVVYGAQLPVAAPASAPAVAPQAAAAVAAPAAQPVAAAGAGPKLADTLAPIVGTFYSSPSPDAPPFVKLGDRVAKGTVLCIIEAMKLMNEIEAETSGFVREIAVSNGDPVEYGQVLFRIEPA